MKVMVNDKELFTLSETAKKVIAHEIPNEMIDQDLERRLQWIIQHKYDRCMERLKKEWIPKLQANGVKSVPLNDEEFAALVFAQPNYKDRSAREAEALRQG